MVSIGGHLAGDEQALGQGPPGDPGRPRRPLALDVPCPLADGGIDAFVQRRDADDAQHGHPGMFQADQRAIQGHAVNERLGAVDGVEDPAEAAPSRPLGQFLAQDGVVGKALGDAAAEVLFRPAVGHGHRRIVRLPLDFQVVAAEVFEGDLPGLAGGRQGQFQSRRQFACRRAHGPPVYHPAPVGCNGWDRPAGKGQPFIAGGPDRYAIGVPSGARGIGGEPKPLLRLRRPDSGAIGATLEAIGATLEAIGATRASPASLTPSPARPPIAIRCAPRGDRANRAPPALGRPRSPRLASPRR